MKLKTVVIPLLVVLGVAVLVGWAARSPLVRAVETPTSSSYPEIEPTVSRVDAIFHERWAEENIEPAADADDLKVMRRLSLALHGTLPSLEEIRRFEADQSPHRLDRWTERMLADNRFADYFAERLARAFVGVEEGQFVVFRRDRFVDWLALQLRSNRPYDDIVREIISQQGLWTDKPASNFVTAAVANDDLDENKLAGRSVRAFLGQRMDCAQCHDHPFDDWKQEDFEGIAAHFGQAGLSIVGVEDRAQRGGESVEYSVEDRETLESRVVPPAVPFGSEWMPQEGTRREMLAAWITHRDNRRFERATVNRVWGLMFGKPYYDPVDDLPNPGDFDETNLLDVLGADFREHGCDVRRLVRVIAASKPFRLSSTHPGDTADASASPAAWWAAFPLARLRPEQLIGSMLQAASIQTIDQNSHLLIRARRFLTENDFVQEYGDLGEDELQEHAGTIPQALLRMNGRFSRESTKADLFSAAGRIAAMAQTDEKCVETCYLVCLSRRPTLDEMEHFARQLDGTTGDERRKIVEDLFWSLFNAPEFSWNH